MPADMIEDIIRLWPVLAGMAAYFVRLEVQLAKIKRDICWIKKILEVPQP